MFQDLIKWWVNPSEQKWGRHVLGVEYGDVWGEPCVHSCMWAGGEATPSSLLLVPS